MKGLMVPFKSKINLIKLFFKFYNFLTLWQKSYILRKEFVFLLLIRQLGKHF